LNVVCKELMHFQTWQAFIQWIDRVGCAILFPQDQHSKENSKALDSLPV